MRSRKVTQARQKLSLRVRCEGNQFHFWLDGKPLGDFADNHQPFLQGGVGVTVANAKVRFRDLKVVSLDGKPLPKLPGPQLLEALKKDPATASIPVVVLSSLPQKNAEKLKHDGASAYFEKSALGVDNGSGALIRAIDEVLRSSHATASAGGKR